MLQKIIKGYVNAQKAKNGSLPIEEVRTAKARIAICNACSSLNKLNMKCTDCGCPVNKKAYSPKSKCPKGKW